MSAFNLPTLLFLLSQALTRRVTFFLYCNNITVQNKMSTFATATIKNNIGTIFHSCFKLQTKKLFLKLFILALIGFRVRYDGKFKGKTSGNCKLCIPLHNVKKT